MGTHSWQCKPYQSTTSSTRWTSPFASSSARSFVWQLCRVVVSSTCMFWMASRFSFSELATYASLMLSSLLSADWGRGNIAHAFTDMSWAAVFFRMYSLSRLGRSCPWRSCSTQHTTWNLSELLAEWHNFDWVLCNCNQWLMISITSKRGNYSVGLQWTFLRNVACQWFLMLLSVLPGSICSHHRANRKGRC